MFPTFIIVLNEQLSDLNVVSDVAVALHELGGVLAIPVRVCCNASRFESFWQSRLLSQHIPRATSLVLGFCHVPASIDLPITF
jgi:hypothetical protein